MAQAAKRKLRIGETDDADSRHGPRGSMRRRVSAAPFEFCMLTTLGISTAVVAIAEIGDKTQLLAIILAATYRQPWTILAGIFTATLLNHTAAAALGYLLGAWLEGPTFRTLLGASFIIMAAWALIPDKEDGASTKDRGSVFLTTLVAFFLVEIGDKTQIATSLLAARFNDVALVAAGTTFGMMLANAPAVFLGDAITRVAPLQAIRIGAALLFAVIGIWIIAAAWWG